MRTKTRTVHFTVDFDGLTRIVRNFWAEHEFDRALSIMTESGISMEVAHDVIRGKKRLAQDPNGRRGVDGCIMDDSWTPNADEAHHCIYPDPLDLPRLAKEGISSRGALDLVQQREAADLLNEICESLSKFDTIEAARLLDIFDALPEKATRGLLKNFKSEWIRECAARVTRDKANAKLGIKSDVDKFVQNQLEMEKRPAPKPTRDFTANNAWIIPSGGFYPLKGPMEHIWAASVIADLTERDAELKGWIKVSLSISGRHIINEKKPTQRQIDTLFDWAQYGPESAQREKTFKNWLTRNELE